MTIMYAKDVNDHSPLRILERSIHGGLGKGNLGVVMARSEEKWAEAEKMCHSAMRMNRRQAQLYLNLAEVYVAADRKQDAADILARGLHYAPHDVRLKMALDRLALRRPPVLAFLPRTHAINRNLGRLRHHALQVLAAL